MSSSHEEYSTAPASPPRDPYRDRTPPYSEAAEQAVISAILIDPESLLRATEFVDETMFFREAHRRIFRAMLSLSERGDVIDPLTLTEELTRTGDLEPAGGRDAIAYLVDVVPTSANIEYHAKIMREKALRRRLIEVSTAIVTEAFESARSAPELLDEAEHRIFEVNQTRGTDGFTRIKELMYDAMERIEQLHLAGESVTGVSSGFKDLDEMTAGFQPSDLVIIAARPSMGKCLAHDARIVLGDGSVVTIEEVYRRRAADILTLGDDWKFRMTRPSTFVDDGEKPVFRVTTRLGRQIETTITHPFRSFSGWRPLAELGVGDKIAVPRVVNVFGTKPLRECDAKLLGYLLGDGELSTTPRFTNTNRRVLDDFTSAIEAFGGVTVAEDVRADRAPTLRVRRDPNLVADERSALSVALNNRLRERGARRQLAASVGVTPGAVTAWTQGTSAPTMTVLNRVSTALGMSREELATAGTAALHTREHNALADWLDELELLGKGAHDKFVPSVIFTAPRNQVALFLNRLFATDGWATVLTSGQSQIGYATVSERLARDVQHLLLRFGIIAALRARSMAYNGERRSAWQLDVTDAISLGAFAREIGMFGKEDRLVRVADALATKSLSESEVYWDEIVSIEAIGMKQVYDLTIPETHNFVANDVCVHNTAFVLNIAQNAALDHKSGVAFFSLEMSKQSLLQRMLTSEARIDAQRLRKGKLRDDEFVQLGRAAGLLSQAPVWIDDTPGISLLEMRSKARRLKAEHDIGMIVIDYLQLMTGPPGVENRQQEISVISRSLKALARELRVPVLALSQLSRAPEQRAGDNKRPQLSDLRESGAIEQDADVVMFLYRQEYYDVLEGKDPTQPDKDGKTSVGMAEVIVGKQRNGPTGTVSLHFNKTYTRFENYTGRPVASGGQNGS